MLLTINAANLGPDLYDSDIILKEYPEGDPTVMYITRERKLYVSASTYRSDKYTLRLCMYSFTSGCLCRIAPSSYGNPFEFILWYLIF